MIKTLGRFAVGALLGFYLVALVGDHPRSALLCAVLGGIFIDQLFRKTKEV
tara:strand:- start:581 stop:733 length:153 start_codon:yes stop_codon:yes gene_type:complete